jgi:S1-C subfamily serine protease
VAEVTARPRRLDSVPRRVKPDTPFGNCGLAKGDLIRAIDDTPAWNAEEFRKLVRRALVRQGDCLITVIRGDKTIDLPVFFPLPK